ncbi:TonB-dependent receptor [Neptunitalea lumnitzerae]|uniref:TonB-dependent receptor plug domain-containing protein n=1 Tax=Neptunitalea lumnitzerae TaxID=2965509 RepID=A0ABQ5MI76_9FLAO|nr:TonB-dependent receptor [Neptunitalea sp. Y10]GLB49114.1 hypothetical protein Y10_14820 [Neptunitalea sp. Y10]
MEKKGKVLITAKNCTTRYYNFKKLIATALCGMLSFLGVAQTVGSCKIKVVDETTKQPLLGVNIHLENTTLGTVSDTLGYGVINNIPAGMYTISLSYLGFQTKKINDVLISVNKTYYAEIELLEETSSLNEVTIRAYRNENNPATPVSSFSYAREEIYRSPGAQGDIMRALATLPGVVSSGSQFSAIAARGQGTRDNVYMVDDIPMLELSHLEAEGFNSGFNDPNGGRFSIFAPRVIDNVQFQNGGFSALYGRRSSSYLGLNIKEGNRESWSFSGQFDLLGATVIADGPVSSKTSMFASGRYQNFGLLINLLGEQKASISYGDYIVKTTTQLNPKNKLSLVAMYNPERPVRTIDDVEIGTNINDDNSGGTTLYDHRGNKLLLGINLRTLLNSDSYLKNVLYYRSSKVDNHFGRFTPALDDHGVIINVNAGRYDKDLRSIKNDQNEIGYRAIYTKRFNRLSLTAGIDASTIHLDYKRNLKSIDTLYTFRSGELENPSQYFQVLNPINYNAHFNKTGFNSSGYITLSWNTFKLLTLNPGIRYDYTGFTNQHSISPRLSGSIQLSQKNSINFATGVYYQDVAYANLAGQSLNGKLKNEKSIQSILGYKLQLSNDLKLVIEGWYKHFNDLVVQPNQFQSYFTNNGGGYAYGSDISMTKRLSKNYYGQISYSYMQSKRNDHYGLGRYDDNFNIPHTISLMGSYKPNDKWIFSGKFRYSTGRPTDQYVVHSNVLNDSDELRFAQEITSINGERFPNFVSIDLRADYNMLTNWGILSAFVDIVNVADRFNINTEVFLPNTGKVYNIGFGIFPTFGVRIEL